MKIYILVAEGYYLAFSDKGTIFSRKCFKDKDLAEKKLPIFLEKAKEDRGELFELDPSTVKVTIKELELV
jgi:hypothetical protein